MAAREWGGSLHETFRLLPKPSPNLEPFLTSEGLTDAEVLAKLPYEVNRRRVRAAPPGTPAPAPAAAPPTPDARRYRDGRHFYQSIGLLYQKDNRICLTELGRTVLRWLPLIHEKNAALLGRPAAYALAVCQLRNPMRSSSKYDADVEVFPFAFIWRAMLRLDNRITTDELNQALFRVTNKDELEKAIEAVKASRNGGPALGPPTITGKGANDRVISWIAAASFGWTLINDKRATGSNWYAIAPRMIDVVADAARTDHKHRDFGPVEEYVKHISDAAALPPDRR